jgi:hypothetical protein
MEGGFGLREIALTASNSRIRSLRSLLSPLQMPSSALSRIAASYGLSDIDEGIDPFSDPAFHKMLRDPEIGDVSAKLGEKTRKGLLLHLQDRGFLGAGRVAVVDVGWGAQIQESLRLATVSVADAPEVDGVYLGTNAAAALRRCAGERIHAILADARDRDWVAGAAFDFVYAFEAITRAPHGTVTGYSEANGEPAFAARETSGRMAEAKDDPSIALVQRGMLAYARLYADCAMIADLRSADTLPYARAVVCRAARFPRPYEANALMAFDNVSNLGSEEVIGLSGATSLLRPISAWRLVSRALWPEGAAAAAGGRLAQMALTAYKARHSWPVSKVGTVTHQAEDADPHRYSALVETIPERKYETASLNVSGRLAEDASRQSPCLPVDRTLSVITLWESLVMQAGFFAANAVMTARRQPRLSGSFNPTVFRGGLSLEELAIRVLRRIRHRIQRRRA